MKNFFDKGNPFVNKDTNKGEKTNTMTDEIKEQENEIVEETEQEAPVEEEIKEDAVEEVPEETTSETDKLKADYETLNNQYLRLAADFDNFRKRQEAELAKQKKIDQKINKHLKSQYNNFEFFCVIVSSELIVEDEKEFSNLGSRIRITAGYCRTTQRSTTASRCL
mgnify:CR=1 FL=1